VWWWAGNRGPDAMTVGVPGNIPYVITVGALSTSTPANSAMTFYLFFLHWP